MIDDDDIVGNDGDVVTNKQTNKQNAQQVTQLRPRHRIFQVQKRNEWINQSIPNEKEHIKTKDVSIDILRIVCYRKHTPPQMQATVPRIDDSKTGLWFIRYSDFQVLG